MDFNEIANTAEA